MAQAIAIPNCQALANEIEIKKKLPENILASISMVESGRLMKNGSMLAWPWSLNHAGKSIFFDNKNQAIEYLKSNITEKIKNIDVGCMQVNVKWHYKNFNSFEEMIDPVKNIQYAAIFLLELKQRYGTWEKAIKHYHSSKSEFNTKYFAKVNRVWAASNKISNKNINLKKATSLFLDKNIFYPETVMPVKSVFVSDNGVNIEKDQQKKKFST
jgi:hypothetical protein